VATVYALPAHRLLSAATKGLPELDPEVNILKVGVRLRTDRPLVRRIGQLARLRPAARSRLWRKLSDWDLRRDEFIAFCPKCCLVDISHGRTPYGRQLWQQAWCTVCNVHRLPLLLRARHTMQNHWTVRQLEHDWCVANACGYGYYRGGPREPSVHYYMIYALIEIQKAAAFAVAGIRPRRRQWGTLSCQSFLQVLSDVTSWALTHFEPVRAWSAAEDLTPIERSEGLKLVGCQQQLMAGHYANKQTHRSLVDITDPAVRGSALWLAHALMSSSTRTRLTAIPE
jgi:hypothetical protein